MRGAPLSSGALPCRTLFKTFQGNCPGSCISIGRGCVHELQELWFRQVNRRLEEVVGIALVAWGFLPLVNSARAQTEQKKLTWHPVEFAIVRFNDAAPNSWNIYHSEKKGVLLVRLWKRYLLVNVSDEQAYDIDPQKIKVVGDSVEWSYADMPEKPIETPNWQDRNIGMMERVRFRLGKDGHFLELQLPLGPNGRPIY